MHETSELSASYNPMMNPDRDDPFARYRELRAEAPVAFVPAFNLWLVSRYDDLLAVLRDRETFSTEGSTSFIAQAAPEVAQILIDAETGQATTDISNFKGDLDSVPETVNTRAVVQVDRGALDDLVRRPPVIYIPGRIVPLRDGAQLT